MRLGRHLVLAALIGAVAAAWAALVVDPRATVDGLLYDLALAVRALAVPESGSVASSESRGEPVAVVALDWRTLGATEIADTPRSLMAPQWAQLIEALAAADARAIGFDIVFAFSADRLIRGYDAPLLAAVDRHHARLVLGRSEQAPPMPALFFAAGADEDPSVLGMIELAPDHDGVFRRVARSFASGAAARPDDARLPTLAGSLLQRAGIAAGDDLIEADILLGPRRRLEAIPVMSMIDVLRCAARDPEALAQHFRGRVVLIGTTLPEEDQRLALDRFMPAPTAPPLPAAPQAAPPRSDAGACGFAHGERVNAANVAGVFLHAAAVRAVLRGEVVRPAPPLLRASFAALAPILGTAIGGLLAPLAAALALVPAVLALFLVAVALLAGDLWLAPGVAIAALVLAVFAAVALQYAVEGRLRRRLERAFGRFVSPAIVARAQAGAALALGGEERMVSVMFADLSGFTALSQRVSPPELMATANRYLGQVTEAIERHGGYVDKFIGDAVMGIWGAPFADPDHAGNAVRAAFAIHAAVAAEAARGSGPALAVKVAIASGPAIVGLVGSERRTNYTTLGRTVNLAARLEKVARDYGIAIDDATAALVADTIATIEVERATIDGFAEKVGVHMPIDPGAADGSALAARLTAARARGDDAAARDAWAALAAVSPLPAALAAAAARLARRP
jgi:class 3 adenylate cyclase/CHASE2 domain-containing sensor protein